MAAALPCTSSTSGTARAIAAILLTAAALLAIALAPPARAQIKAAASAVNEVDAVLALISFDRDTRIAMLQGSGGVDLSFTVPADVQMFERVRPGELFSMRYTLLRTHELHKSGVASVSEAQAREFDAADGRLVGRLVKTRRVSLRVEAINEANGSLALYDANGTLLTVSFNGHDQGLEHVTVGDTITLVTVESVELQILLP